MQIITGCMLEDAVALNDFHSVPRHDDRLRVGRWVIDLYNANRCVLLSELLIFCSSTFSFDQPVFGTCSSESEIWTTFSKMPVSTRLTSSQRRETEPGAIWIGGRLGRSTSPLV